MKNFPIGVKLAGVLSITMVIVLGISFFIQNLVVSKNLANLSTLSAQAVYDSVSYSMKDLLEKGNMELFYQTLDRSAEGSNVVGIALHNGEGIQVRASKNLPISNLDSDLINKLKNVETNYMVQNNDVMDIYGMDYVTKDCIRCHSGWKEGDPGAILHIRYSKADLLNAQNTNLVTIIISMLVTTIALVICLLVFLRFLVVKPLEKMARVAQLIGSRNLADLVGSSPKTLEFGLSGSGNRAAIQLFDVKNRDEIGIMGFAFQEIIGFIREITGITSQVATGDLSIEIQPRSDKDIMGISLKTMIEEFRKVIIKLAENSNYLRHASSELAAVTSETESNTSQIYTEIQKMAEDTQSQNQLIEQARINFDKMTQNVQELRGSVEEQFKGVEKANEITTKIVASIKQVAGNADSVTKGSARVSEAAQIGAKTIDATVLEMQNIKAKTELTAIKIQEMGERSQQIGNIVNAIEEIASQTNLLALNAAIEAARAGEHGKGFAVVAEEVRKLSYQASSSTKEIKTLIEGIQKTAAEADIAMEAGIKEVESGVIMANQAGQSLVDILQAVGAVTEESVHATNATQQMSSYSSQLADAVIAVSGVAEENRESANIMLSGYSEISKEIASISVVSEQNSAAMTRVAASIQEIRQKTNETTSSTLTLKTLAEDLQQAIKSFKLNSM